LACANIQVTTIQTTQLPVITIVTCFDTHFLYFNMSIWHKNEV